MTGPQDVQALFAPYARLVDEKLITLFDAQPKLAMYDMQRYFMGFADESFRPLKAYGGKRFRSGLTLLLADRYNVKDDALSIAVAIELFHNFTLIHDDIEDNDEMRRGRPTVWKLWGVPHAINAGDAQLILVGEVLGDGCRTFGDKGYDIQHEVLSRFREVAEGQYLDFVLTEVPLDDPLVTEAHYFEMLMKKTSVLVGISAEVVGMIADLNDDERRALWDYGLHLGVAYQLCDDCMSIWGSTETTGKHELGDIKEKKKTLPVLWAMEELGSAGRERLVELYGKSDPLTQEEAEEVKALLDTTNVHERVRARIDKYYDDAKEAVAKLSLSDEHKEELAQVMGILLPETRS